MNRKLKNTLALAGILLFIVVIGGVFSFVYQKGKIKDYNAQITKLKSSGYNSEELISKLKDLEQTSITLDSIISQRKFNIPRVLPQTHFYNFVNRISADFSPDTYINIEFTEFKKEKHFNYYIYQLTGTGEYNDVYRLIYAIEQSKELKKIFQGNMQTNIVVDSDGYPQYLVNFAFTVYVYFADDDRFTTIDFTENELAASEKYDVFYPLVRNELPPNSEDLLEVEGAKLLALIPDGAFIADSKGNTFMLWEGDQVYLGYLTKIDYKNNQVTFILNKGGIIEKVFLEMQKEENRKRK